MNPFPSDVVSKLTGTKCGKNPRMDTYVSFHNKTQEQVDADLRYHQSLAKEGGFSADEYSTPGCAIPYENLKELLRLKIVSGEDGHNESPSVDEFLKILKPLAKHIRFMGYVIYPPRNDARVSIDGFFIEGVDKETIKKIQKKFHSADEIDVVENKESFDGRFWWD